MRKFGTLPYLQSKIGTLGQEDASKELGEPTRPFSVVDGPPGKVYSYADPMRLYREFVLNFDAVTGKLREVYNITWKRYHEIVEGKVKTVRDKGGTNFYIYTNRRLRVHVDDIGNVIGLSVF
jgi:hypothetical protein